MLLRGAVGLNPGEVVRRAGKPVSGVSQAELIEGVVYVPSPVRMEDHADQHSALNWWLLGDKAHTPGVRVGDNATIRLDEMNERQGDCSLFIKPTHGGRVVIDADGYISGAPDLVGEVASSSVSYDLGVKLECYRRHEVREYIVWRVYDQELDGFVLRDGAYERQSPGAYSLLRSSVFPGLWLDPAALLRDDDETLLAVLERGLDSPEHAAFVAELARRNIEPAV